VADKTVWVAVVRPEEAQWAAKVAAQRAAKVAALPVARVAAQRVAKLAALRAAEAAASWVDRVVAVVCPISALG
jgi:hypothetical protein